VTVFLQKETDRTKALKLAIKNYFDLASLKIIFQAFCFVKKGLFVVTES